MRNVNEAKRVPGQVAHRNPREVEHERTGPASEYPPGGGNPCGSKAVTKGIADAIEKRLVNREGGTTLNRTWDGRNDTSTDPGVRKVGQVRKGISVRPAWDRGKDKPAGARNGWVFAIVMEFNCSNGPSPTLYQLRSGSKRAGNSPADYSPDAGTGESATTVPGMPKKDPSSFDVAGDYVEKEGHQFPGTASFSAPGARKPGTSCYLAFVDAPTGGRVTQSVWLALGFVNWRKGEPEEIARSKRITLPGPKGTMGGNVKAIPMSAGDFRSWHDSQEQSRDTKRVLPGLR